jgi:hypothetical protein
LLQTTSLINAPLQTAILLKCTYRAKVVHFLTIDSSYDKITAISDNKNQNTAWQRNIIKFHLLQVLLKCAASKNITFSAVVNHQNTLATDDPIKMRTLQVKPTNFHCNRQLVKIRFFETTKHQNTWQ